METPPGDPADPKESPTVSPEPAPPQASGREPVPANPVCAAHPRQAAVTRCASCGKQLCTLCIFSVGEWSFCGDCAVRQAVSEPGPRLCTHCGRSMAAETKYCFCGHAYESPEIAAPPRTQARPEGSCVNHPDTPAVVRCALCARSICDVCEFVLPGSIHVCPSCIEAQSTADASPKRKNWSYLALIFAAWSTILSALLFGGLFNSILNSENGDAFDRVLTAAIMWPSVIGTGIALAARDKRLKNTGLMNAAVWWNAAIAGIFLLLILANNLGLTGE